MVRRIKFCVERLQAEMGAEGKLMDEVVRSREVVGKRKKERVNKDVIVG